MNPPARFPQLLDRPRTGEGKNPEMPASRKTTPNTMAIVPMFIGPPSSLRNTPLRSPRIAATSADSLQSGFLMHNLDEKGSAR